MLVDLLFHFSSYFHSAHATRPDLVGNSTLPGNLCASGILVWHSFSTRFEFMDRICVNGEREHVDLGPDGYSLFSLCVGMGRIGKKWENFKNSLLPRIFKKYLHA